MEILEQYIRTIPSAQNALDIFKGEWASLLPQHLSSLRAGGSQLFEDSRVTWAIERLNGVEGQNILELGPLEGGHSYMLEKSGAKAITSIESNTRAYLKCLVVKEIVPLKKTHFLLGDCTEYLQNCSETFDVCFASGILYHMKDPIDLIYLISKVANKVFIWTHYYDASVISETPRLAAKFSENHTSDYKGFEHRLYRYEYQEALDSALFCGGSNAFSFWMSRETILSCLKYFGFKDIQVNFEVKNHQNGPCFALVAIK